MTYQAFAGIGSRETPRDVLKQINLIAYQMAGEGFTLRSGGADGADDAFEQFATKKEIYLPYDGFNGRRVDNVEYFLWTEEARIIAANYHPAWMKLNESAKKFHSRNVHQVLGLDLKTPVKFVVCWTKDGMFSGGTGQALRIADDHDIPICNLKNITWKEWYAKNHIFGH